MASTNRFPGLARGPFDHEASSVINLISKATIAMGDVVELDQTAEDSKNILPKVTPATFANGKRVYGIAVGGDVDGIYGDGSTPTDDAFRATNAEGQGVVVVTQGRCLARVNGSAGGAVVVGDKLIASTIAGELRKQVTAATGVSSGYVIATALQPVLGTNLDMILVDVQREGENSQA